MSKIDFNDGTSVELEITDGIVKCQWPDGGVIIMHINYFREIVRDAATETLQHLRDDGVEVELQKKYKTIYKG
ncbi:MAG: hypothetical protein LUD72_13585 [Bacteroidales bacterium]|nr:hypothetical protein [Bacteroidales bacterium]